ncbi:hypothetical protein B0H13DRAFT_2393622 [Mycena leptocephala]|nr:hypothetical protein B0H13DRAFT_2393622 [Mycena leptocephala]
MADPPPQLLQDSNREIRLLNTLLQRTAQDPAVKQFTDDYIALVKKVIRTRLDESAKKNKAQAAYMGGLAGIASFLASVQIGFFPIIGDPDCDTISQPGGCKAHEIFIRALINFFAYLALSFDALGALFALLTARSLVQVSGDAQDLMEDKYSLDGLILGQVEQLGPLDKNMFEALSAKLKSLDLRVARQEHILVDHAGGGHGVISFILLGMICFFVALILQIIQSQPVKFWIPFVVLVFTMACMITRTEKRHHTGLWFRVRSWINVPSPEPDPEKAGVGLITPDTGTGSNRTEMLSRSRTRIYDSAPERDPAEAEPTMLPLPTTANAPELPNLNMFLSTTATWLIPEGFDKVSQAAEFFVILLQIERTVQRILKDPTAKSLISSDSVLDSVSRAKCRELWEMMFTGVEEVMVKLRLFRKQNQDSAANSSSNAPPLVDSCIDWWADRLSKLQTMSYRQDSHLLFRIHLKHHDKVTLNHDIEILKETLKKMEGFANIISPTATHFPSGELPSTLHAPDASATGDFTSASGANV